MKCQGDKHCKKEAGYRVKLYDEKNQDNFWFYVCGYCLVGRYISSRGLKEGVLEVVRL